ESPNPLEGLSPEAKRKLLAELLRDKAAAPGPLSYGQRALWYLHRLEPDSAFYNVSWAWWVRSALDEQALRAAFQGLVDRHRILRTTFADRDGQPAARVQDPAVVDFQTVAAGGWSDADLRQHTSEEAHRPFNLERG